MNAVSAFKPDSRFDLVLDRVVDAPVDLLWEAWTTPAHLKHWFVPKPWTITHCEVDLRQGGKFHFVMRSPEGKEFPNTGCFLDIVPKQRLVWTDALLPDYRPSENPFFTAVLTFEPVKSGTRYIATAIHRNEANRMKHEEMGFHSGWGTVLDQLVVYTKTMR